MSVFFGRSQPPAAPQEQRAVYGADFTGYPHHISSSFANFDLSTAESSLQKVAVWASVQYIIRKATSLPVDFYIGKGADQREIPMPGWLEDPAGDGYGFADWWAQALYSALLRGNVYGVPADFDTRNGLPRVLPLVHPDRVKYYPNADDGRPEWYIDGQKQDRGRFWHRRLYVSTGSVQGLSPIRQHALTLGVSLAALRFGEQWFQDGAHPNGILTNDQVEMNKVQADTAKKRFLAATQGTREPVVLGRGWQFKPLQIAPEESQFLETNNYTGAECTRIFGPGLAQVFGYETGRSLTYSNRVDLQTSLQTDVLDPWLTWSEQIVSATLLPKNQFMKVNRNALVRANLEDRFAAYAVAIENGWMTADEVRSKEDWPALTDAQKAEIMAMKSAGAPAAPATNTPPAVTK